MSTAFTQLQLICKSGLKPNFHALVQWQNKSNRPAFLPRLHTRYGVTRWEEEGPDPSDHPTPATAQHPHTKTHPSVAVRCLYCSTAESCLQETELA